jgi:predicted nucleotidyltransferase
MIKRQRITAFVKQVAAQFHPQRIILFGSYAYGKPTTDSDVDLLVVMPHEGHPAMQAAEIRKQVHAGFPMDLVVRSPKEIQRRLAMHDFFISEIMERGQPLYEG